MNPGDVIAGKYRIERLLGEGGMGKVVAATHLQLDEKVAIKVMLPELVGKTGIVERFIREARSAVKLKSEHVGRIMDVATLEDGSPYIVMEYLDGCDLGSLIKANGAIPTESAAHYVLQACEALAEAHFHGIIHRDIKPPNLFLTQRADGSPLIKVLDFGIAKAAPTESDFQLTQTGAVFGSPGYMSPEQLRSARDVDARTDIWALGVVLYELCSGRPPFDAETFSELCLKVAMDPFGPLPPTIPPQFAQIVYRCLEKDPARRYNNVAELAMALAPFAPPFAHNTALRTARMLKVDSALPGTIAAPSRLPAPTPVPAVGTVPGDPAAMVGTGPAAASKPTTLSTAASESMAMPTPAPSKKKFAAVGAILVICAVIGVSVALSIGGGDDPPAAAAGTEQPDAGDPAGETEPEIETETTTETASADADAGAPTADTTAAVDTTPDAAVDTTTASRSSKTRSRKSRSSSQSSKTTTNSSKASSSSGTKTDVKKDPSKVYGTRN